MGLDRESDVVHIETRVAKGRECRISVHRNGEPTGTFASHLERGQWQNETFGVLQNRCLPATNGGFRHMDVSLNGLLCVIDKSQFHFSKQIIQVEQLLGNKAPCCFSRALFFHTKAHRSWKH